MTERPIDAATTIKTTMPIETPVDTVSTGAVESAATAPRDGVVTISQAKEARTAFS